MQIGDKFRYFTSLGAAVLQSAPIWRGFFFFFDTFRARGAFGLFSTTDSVCVPTHPDIKERLWCAALAISQPLVRVLSISARKVGQSTVISPMEMTSSRYRATSVLNSWTICVAVKRHTT